MLSVQQDMPIHRSTNSNNKSLGFNNIIQNSNKYVLHKKVPVLYKGGKGYLETGVIPIDDQKDSVWFVTKISDNKNNTLGSYDYKVHLPSKEINSGYIHTAGSYRHKGIGEIMRLASLVELKENNMKAIELNALPEAIPFHYNYKFKSNVTQRFWAIKILKKICNNPNIQEPHRQKADSLRKHISQKSTWLLEKTKAKSVNYFIQNILKLYVSNWQKSGFDIALPMILTRDNLNKYSSFYNKLLKAHGINYKI